MAEGQRNPIILVGTGAGALGAGAIAAQLANVNKTKLASTAARVFRGKTPTSLAVEEMQALRSGMATPVRWGPPLNGPGIPAGPIGSTGQLPISSTPRLGPAFSTGPKALESGPFYMGPKSAARGIPMGNSNLPLGTQVPTQIPGMGNAIPAGRTSEFLPGSYSAREISNMQALGAQTQAELTAGQNMGKVLSSRGGGGIPSAGGGGGGGVPSGGGGVPSAGGIPQMPAAALEAPATSAAGESAGILARLGFGGEGAAGATGVNALIRAGLTPMKALGIVGTGAALGNTAASYIVDPLNIGGKNSGLDRFLTGATFGAGLGAGIGNVIPIPGVGAAIGAGAGALIGGTANTIKGWFDDRGMTEVSAKNQKRYANLTGLMDTAGLTQRQREMLMSQYNTQMQLVGDDTKAQKMLLDSLEQQVVGLAGSNPYQVTGQDLIGLQAQIQDYMRPLQERMSASSTGLAAAYNNIASQMQSPQLADAMRLQGTNVQAAADRQILANAQSASALPASYGLQMNNLVRSQTPSAGSDLASQLAGN